MKIDPRKIAIDSGYLVYETDACTCDGNNEVTDLHRPGCGNEPIITLEELTDVLDMDAPEGELHQLKIVDNDLVIDHGEHNCVGGTIESSGQHEPTCGMDWVMSVETLAERLVVRGVVT